MTMKQNPDGSLRTAILIDERWFEYLALGFSHMILGNSFDSAWQVKPLPKPLEPKPYKVSSLASCTVFFLNHMFKGNRQTLNDFHQWFDEMIQGRLQHIEANIDLKQKDSKMACPECLVPINEAGVDTMDGIAYCRKCNHALSRKFTEGQF